MNDIHLPESIPVTVVLHHMQNLPQETINNPKDSEFSRLSSTVKNKWPVGHRAPSLSTSVVFVIALSPAGCLSVCFLFMSPDCQPLEGQNRAVDASLSPVEWLKCLAGDGRESGNIPFFWDCTMDTLSGAELQAANSHIRSAFYQQELLWPFLVFSCFCSR